MGNVVCLVDYRIISSSACRQCRANRASGSHATKVQILKTNTASKLEAVRLDRADRYEKTAKNLMRLAWSIEGMAVLIGLSIAFSRVQDANQTGTADVTFWGGIQLMGGFIIVSMGELTKIPLSMLLVNGRLLLKPLVFLVLLFVSAITFETVFLSLERGYNYQKADIHEYRDELRVAQEALDTETERTDIDRIDGQIRSEQAYLERIAGDNMNPTVDTSHKIASLPLHRDATVLDTCCGLGYTSIEAARKGCKVTTIEYDPLSLELCHYNPWSRALFEQGSITVEVGDACELVRHMPSGSFSFVVHDPPARNLCSTDLYGLDFYRELRRVLKTNGQLYHYIGNPTSKESGKLFAGIISRLGEAGFASIKKADSAFGLVASAAKR